MKKLFYGLLLLTSLQTQAQENITFQKPSTEILALADYVRPPQLKISGCYLRSGLRIKAWQT
ncbi:hypothetical protein [Sphingobacterium multivorum]|uniref:hypothetical protein n=1 Tax=Sphingobacterium multivorum TaxID=28454 RepID=UPI002FDEB94D